MSKVIHFDSNPNNYPCKCISWGKAWMECQECEVCEKAYPAESLECKNKVFQLVKEIRMVSEEAGFETAGEVVQKTPKVKKEKVARSKYGHAVDSISGAIDEVLVSGAVLKVIAEQVSAKLNEKVNAGRVKGHVRHLRDAHKLVVDFAKDAAGAEIVQITGA